MLELLKLFTSIINYAHDAIVNFVRARGYNLTDKDLHFIIIALMGLTIFICVQILFKFLSKYSITAISFIYTFTVLVVIVFAIEIQQKLTNRGNMEFADIVYGLYGFLCIFAVYLLIKGVIWAVKKGIGYYKNRTAGKYEKVIETQNQDE